MRLTSVISEVEKELIEFEGFSLKEKISIKCGSRLETACKLIVNILPYSKVAVFYSEKEFFDFGVRLTELMKRFSLKPINILLDKAKNFDVKRASGLFNIAEDVRAVIVTDKKISDYALYYATIKSIPLIAITNGCDFFEYFKTYVKPFSRDLDNVFSCDCKRYIIIDENSAKMGDFSLPYAYAVSKIISLYDYRINASLSNLRANERAYSLAKDGIYQVIKAFESGGEERNEKILRGALKVAFSDFITNGELFRFSSAQAVAELLGQNKDEGAELISSLYLLAYYPLLSFDNDLVFNYKPQVEITSALTGVSIGVINDYAIKRLTKMKDLDKAKKRKMISLAVECEKNLKYVPSLLKRYFMLGGKAIFSSERIKRAISMAGELSDNVNGLSMLTEKGLFMV